jgi:hypothetical protein
MVCLLRPIDGDGSCLRNMTRNRHRTKPSKVLKMCGLACFQ